MFFWWVKHQKGGLDRTINPYCQTSVSSCCPKLIVVAGTLLPTTAIFIFSCAGSWTGCFRPANLNKRDWQSSLSYQNPSCHHNHILIWSPVRLDSHGILTKCIMVRLLFMELSLFLFTTFRRKNVPMYAKLCYTYFRITTNKKHKMKESRNI